MAANLRLATPRPMGTGMSYVVVVFGSSSPDWCDLNHCPMYALGPFATQGDAKAAAELHPDWMRAHVLSMRSEPESAVMAQIERTVADPSTRVRRGRPKRKEDR